MLFFLVILLVRFWIFSRNDREGYYYHCRTCKYDEDFSKTFVKLNFEDADNSKGAENAEESYDDRSESGDCFQTLGRPCNYIICSTCILTCHADTEHEVEYFGYGQHFCNCGKRGEESCISLKSKFC